MGDALINRVQDLQAVMSEYTTGKTEPFFVGIVCNGCGHIEQSMTVAGLNLDGWYVSDFIGGDDFCPACARAKAKAKGSA